MTFSEKNSAFRQRVMDNLKERGFTIGESDSFWIIASRDGKTQNFPLSPYAYFDGEPEKHASKIEEWFVKDPFCAPMRGNMRSNGI